MKRSPAVKQLGPTDLKRLHREWNRRSTRRLALLLDGVSVAVQRGRHRPHRRRLPGRPPVPGGGATSPGHAKAGKTALGTERYLSWTVFERSPDAADAAREDGYAVVGLELADGAVPLHLSTPGPTCAWPSATRTTA